jgi:twitching motility protein PilI
MNTDYLQISLANNNSLLISTTNTVEIISRKTSDICPIPGLISSLLGVVNQRGRLLWVLDLADFLGSPENLRNDGFQADSTRKRKEEVTIVVLADAKEITVEERRATIGCLVAGLQEIISLADDRIDPFVSETGSDFFAGTTVVENLSMPILNLTGLFDYLQYNSSIFEA